ncbi:hypothetical protein [Pedobacter faecalis]|uniref:hypothetical protein n=1 Tax=Pedobacter faecalis TaxID=3041495 RepID=UPI00254DD048|nr:hypothetical protein [Pedobacter sp. ELA7]
MKLNIPLLVLLNVAFSVLIISCNRDGEKSSKKATQKQNKSKNVLSEPGSGIQNTAPEVLQSDTAVEVMDEKDILLNGKLKRYFSLKQFHSVLGKPDSSQLLSDVEPCTNIFQEPDGSVHPEARYLFKNGSRFECSQEKVAIDEVNFSHGDFIIFRKQRLNRHTTLATLKKLFPNAAKHIGVMDVAGEGALQVIKLREDKDNISDGHINVFLKFGKLYLLQWWFPC